MKWVCKIFLLSLFLFMKRRMTASAFKLKKYTKVKIPVYNISLWPFFLRSFHHHCSQSSYPSTIRAIRDKCYCRSSKKTFEIPFGIRCENEQEGMIHWAQTETMDLRFGNGDDKEVEIVIDDVSKCIAKLLKFLNLNCTLNATWYVS